MAYFYQPPMPPIPPGATLEQRRAMFDAYCAQVREANPQLNTSGGLFRRISNLFRRK